MKQYFYCNDCEDIFAEEDARVLWESNGYGSVEMYACPTCRSTAITDAGSCEVCGRPINPGKHICECCLQELHKSWAAMVEKAMDLRQKADNGLSTDYLDCEQSVMEFLREVGLVI